MKLKELYNYFQSNKEEFFQRLEQCITKNNISTDNDSYPMLKEIYEEVRKNKINEHIKPTRERFKAKVKNEY